jgi:hypothetical protein
MSPTRKTEEIENTSTMAQTNKMKTKLTPTVTPTSRKKKEEAEPTPTLEEAEPVSMMATTSKMAAAPTSTVAAVYDRVKITKSLKAAIFKDSNGFFELNKVPLDSLVDWLDFRSYTEVAISGSRLFRISLVGIDSSKSGKVGAPKMAARRKTSRALSEIPLPFEL